MGTPARSHGEAAGTLPPLHAAISTVATAQILRAAGYSAAEPAALRSLSDIAGNYISSLGIVASAIAESRGRTEPNLLDLTLALEDHALTGFLGASDPARPVLHSGVLSELAGFVKTVREVPFAKPIPRREVGFKKGRESFAAVGREPPLRHVPRWLPCFPEGWRRGEAEEKEMGALVVLLSGNGVERKEERRKVVPEKREKVSFRVGDAGEKRRRGGSEKLLFSQQ